MNPPGWASAPEHELLFLCARPELDPEQSRRVDAILAHPLDWPAIRRLAGWHGTEPLTAHHLAERETVPPEAREDFRKLLQTRARHAFVQAGETLAVVRLLDSSGIPVAAYKGASLASVFYGNLSLRAGGDVDLLIAPKSFPKAHRLLQSAGYLSERPVADAAVDALVRRGRCLVYLSPRHRIPVDLQWRAVPPRFGFRLDIEAMLARRVQTPLLEQPVWTLAGEDLLLTLCLHGSKHGWDRLIWLTDLRQLFIRFSDLDWRAVEARAEEGGARAPLLLGLLMAHLVLDARLPEHLDALIRTDRRIKPLSQYLCGRLFTTAPTRRGLWRYELMLESGIGARLRHLCFFLRRVLISAASRKGATGKLGHGEPDRAAG